MNGANFNKGIPGYETEQRVVQEEYGGSNLFKAMVSPKDRSSKFMAEGRVKSGQQRSKGFKERPGMPKIGVDKFLCKQPCIALYPT